MPTCYLRRPGARRTLRAEAAVRRPPFARGRETLNLVHCQPCSEVFRAGLSRPHYVTNSLIRDRADPHAPTLSAMPLLVRGRARRRSDMLAGLPGGAATLDRGEHAALAGRHLRSGSCRPAAALDRL